jgi:beta-exotoxin I transport system ATP-binding protein
VADAAAIETSALSKTYRGGVRALDGLELRVERGEVFGFLGPNGAGKSTTIRLLLDLIRPTSGSAALLGLDTRRTGVAARRRVGYLPGDLRLYDRLTGREQLDSLVRLRGVRDGAYRDELVARFTAPLDRPIRELSKGNRQKVGLVQAFMHRPELVSLDEPTAGLDPLVQREFRRLVLETKADGRTVFLSSHVLSEVQHVADRVGLIRDGRLLVVEAVETLRQRAAVRVEVAFASPPEPSAFDGVPNVRELARHGNTVLFALHGEADPLVKALARHRVLGLDSHEADLEDVFLSLYGEEGADAPRDGRDAS